jgi:hypothetical protein
MTVAVSMAALTTAPAQLPLGVLHSWTARAMPVPAAMTPAVSAMPPRMGAAGAHTTVAVQTRAATPTTTAVVAATWLTALTTFHQSAPRGSMLIRGLALA